MKVLLLCPMADGQTGSAIKFAFKQLGHDVEVIDAKLKVGNSYDAACMFEPELVFCSRTKALTEQVIQIKKRFKDTIICMWNMDTRANINKWSHLFPLIRLCNYHFVPDTKTIPEWRKLNPNTFWLPQGLQEEVYDKPREITDEDKIRYSCDVSFAGSVDGSHKNRGCFLDAIKGMGVNYKFWGCYGVPRVYDEEHNKMVSLSKINLALSGWPSNGKYTSVRNYKIMGVGGFVLELYRAGIYEIFPGNTFGCYYDVDDLVRVIRYWLDHEREREEIAARGYDWVHTNATYTHRIQQALEIMRLK